MPVIEYSDPILIGLQEVDDAHKSLLAATVALGSLITADPLSDAADLLDRLDGLVRIFDAHTATEEDFLYQLRSPAGLAHRCKHMARHQQFRDEVTKIRARIAARAPAAELIEKLSTFLMLFDLINIDYDMVTLLKREGILTGEEAVAEANDVTG